MTVHLRTAVIEVLAYRCPKTARDWAQAYTPDQCMPPQDELPRMNKFIFGLFSRLPHMPDREVACLSGNFANVDHWLRDFANVVSPIIVEQRELLFGPVVRQAPVPSLADLIYD